MKIYTRTGDEGTTALFGGDRVVKSHPRIEAYGTVDELNAVLGVHQRDVLTRLQHELFVLGADLATPDRARPTVPRVDADHIARLEADIDAADADLAPLRRFILPGGTRVAAELHLSLIHI